MMRYIRYAFVLVLGLVLLVVALANREWVALKLLPDDIARLTGTQATMSLPLFVVILGGVAAGVIIGFVWEWLREHRYRSQAALRAREVAQLQREVGRLRDTPGPKDEVLALLEDTRKAS